MGDLKVGEGFIDAVMIRVTATGAAALGLAPTCTLTRLSTGARVGLTVAEVSDGIYKVTDMAPGFDDEFLTEWAVAGAYTIYQAFKLFKVGGGVIADWENGGRLDLLIDGIIADIGVFPSANYATIAAYVEDIRARLIVILADVTGLAGAAMRGTDGAALVADGWDAALATILDNFSALRIGYLDQLDFALQEAIAALQTDLDNPNQYKADLTTLETRLSAARAGYLDQLDFNLQEAIAAIQADIGVFPTANYATLAAYVEDIRTRLIAIVADTGAIAWGDVTGIVNDIGVFPTANYATLAAYVEDIRARMVVILADVTGLAGAAMRGTDGAALVASGWDAGLATILDNFTALRIGYLDELDFDLQAKLIEIDAEVEGLAGAAMRGTDGAATVADGWDAALATILDNFTALRIGYLDELDFDLAATLAALDVLLDGIIADIGVFPSANYATLAAYVEDIRARLIVILADVTGLNGDVMRGTDGAALVASGWDAALATILDNFTALRIGYLDELDFDLAAALALLATEAKQDIIDGNVDDIELRVQYLVNKNIFWSLYQEEVQLTSVAADVNLPNVVLPNITGTIVRVYGVFKFRAIENTNAAVNAVNVAQAIRIKKSTGAWGVDDVALIDIPDNMFSVAALSREMGDVMAGENEVHGEVDIFNATYNVRWENGDVDQNNMNFNDVQVGLIVEWY